MVQNNARMMEFDRMEVGLEVFTPKGQGFQGVISAVPE
jgi:hypothetical protein